MHPLSECDLVIHSIMSDRTSLQQHLPYQSRWYTVYRTAHPSLDLSGKLNYPRLSEHLFASVAWANVFFMSQTPDHWFIKPACLLSVFSQLYFVVCNEYASGKCIGVKVDIFIRKCSGVKVKVDRNIKTQVKFRYSQQYLNTVTKYYYFVFITPLLKSIHYSTE